MNHTKGVYRLLLGLGIALFLMLWMVGPTFAFNPTRGGGVHGGVSTSSPGGGDHGSKHGDKHDVNKGHEGQENGRIPGSIGPSGGMIGNESGGSCSFSGEPC